MPLSARKRQNALYEETITERPLRLFGKEFPFGTVTSHKQYYRLMDEETAQKSGEEQLRRAFLQYEAEKLSDSAILSREEHFSKKGSVLSLTVRYTAERNIAQTVPVTMREFTVQPENS